MSKKQRDVKKMIEKRRYELAIIMSTLSTLLKVHDFKLKINNNKTDTVFLTLKWGD